ncbi:MAG: preprotein translocase subunit SecE [Candidatus Zambryskibacteria bacterium RIFCSPHIGHO2_01_FULL_44_22b]|uniref:Protein translocase subunit SecE n=1 Tax=Candidatus Zambryskibacteria bacterium RIFCSPHIGHO2_01_FULL_44_22b TaxID=1802737 RepID=A0A1G2SZV7_9BACT|nr:MAG: preprotein translocase subunit SecE [Candidatus Zambryskibacteria bacterium RIFCSPHIGHO2_01_FULL_44_22b]
MQRLINYFRETRGELQYVSWPSRRQAIAFTAVTIIISLLSAAYLGFFDYLFSLLLQKFVL